MTSKEFGEIERVYCNKCHGVLRYKDHVYLDVHNSILHQRCFQSDVIVKEGGTLKKIVNKYDFFGEFRLGE